MDQNFDALKNHFTILVGAFFLGLLIGYLYGLFQQSGASAKRPQAHRNSSAFEEAEGLESGGRRPNIECKSCKKSQAFFSPACSDYRCRQKENCHKEHDLTKNPSRPILDAIKGAKKSIDICVYRLSFDQFVNELIIAHKLNKNLKIRILIDPGKSSSDNQNNNNNNAGVGGQQVVHQNDTENHFKSLNRLKKEGIQVKALPKLDGLMHNKFTIIDDTLFLGSFNWTWSGIYRNCESLIKLAQAKIVQQFRKEFNDLWNNSQSWESTADV